MANRTVSVLEGAGLAELKRRYRIGKLTNGSKIRRRSPRPNLGKTIWVWSSGMTTGRRMKRRKKVEDKQDRRTSLGRDGGWVVGIIIKESSNPSSLDSMGECSPWAVERYP